MNRTRRSVAVFLLTLAVALPAAALPVPARTVSWESLLALLSQRLAPVFSVFEKSRSSADPDGNDGTATPPTGENPAAEPPSDGDSRSSADPNG